MKRGQATEGCQSHKGNDLHPSDASASTVLARAVGWRKTTGETARYRGASIIVTPLSSWLHQSISAGDPEGWLMRVLASKSVRRATQVNQ